MQIKWLDTEKKYTIHIESSCTYCSEMITGIMEYQKISTAEAWLTRVLQINQALDSPSHIVL